MGGYSASVNNLKNKTVLFRYSEPRLQKTERHNEKMLIKLEGERSFSHLDAASFPSQFHRHLSSDYYNRLLASSYLAKPHQTNKHAPMKKNMNVTKYLKDLSHNMLIHAGLLLNIGTEDLNPFSHETFGIVSFKSNQFG